jgi:hypothetical protein
LRDVGLAPKWYSGCLSPQFNDARSMIRRRHLSRARQSRVPFQCSVHVRVDVDVHVHVRVRVRDVHSVQRSARKETLGQVGTLNPAQTCNLVFSGNHDSKLNTQKG